MKDKKVWLVTRGFRYFEGAFDSYESARVWVEHLVRRSSAIFYVFESVYKAERSDFGESPKWKKIPGTRS